jgi:hypothetical protein
VFSVLSLNKKARASSQLVSGVSHPHKTFSSRQFISPHISGPHAIQRSVGSSRQSSSEVHPASDPSPDSAGGSTFVCLSGNISAARHSDSFRTFLAANTVLEGRRATEAVLSGQDDRLLVVVG